MGNKIFRSMVVATIALSVGLAWAEADPNAGTAVPLMPHLESWIGNSFSGRQAVLHDGVALAVSPDGHCFVIGGGYASGTTSGIYRNGQTIGELQDLPYGDGAVAADAKYVFAATRPWDISNASRQMTPADMALAPALPFGVCRFHLDGTPAPAANGSNYLSIGKKWIGGACLHRGELFVGDSSTDTVLVFDAESLAQKRKFALPQPYRMAVDGTNHLWAISRIVNDSSNQPATLKQFTLDGKPTGKSIADADGAMAVAGDAAGHLLVAGPHEQVIVYDIATPTPRAVRTLGNAGGVYSGVTGEMAPEKLLNVVGIGSDESGNFYTLSRAPAQGGGVDLRAFAPSGKLLWNIVSTQNREVGWVDPASDGADFYTRDEHFVLDLAKPAGEGWAWRGYTLSPEFDDARLRDNALEELSAVPPREIAWAEGRANAQEWSAPIIRRLQGRLYMFERPGARLGIFRKGPGELFVPSGLIGTGPNLPQEKVRWMWRDSNGDGRVQPDEVESKSFNSGITTIADTWVDSNGDIWMVGTGAVSFGSTTDAALWHLPLRGFDAHQNPIYTPSFDLMPRPAPPEFAKNSVRRIAYDAEHDVMYLAGTTESDPQSLSPESVGTQIVRYDHWSKGPYEARWHIVLPEEQGRRSKEEMVSGDKDGSWFESFAVAGGRVFCQQHAHGTIFAYNNDTGAVVGKFGPQAGDNSGPSNLSDGLHAFKRKNGTYLIFAASTDAPSIRLYQLLPYTVGGW